MNVMYMIEILHTEYHCIWLFGKQKRQKGETVAVNEEKQAVGFFVEKLNMKIIMVIL